MSSSTRRGWRVARRGCRRDWWCRRPKALLSGRCRVAPDRLGPVRRPDHDHDGVRHPPRRAAVTRRARDGRAEVDVVEERVDLDRRLRRGRQRLAQRPRHRIGAAAGGEGNDDAHRPRRPGFLRQGRAAVMTGTGVTRVEPGDDGLTVLVNLHDLDTARHYCDRIVAMQAGRGDWVAKIGAEGVQAIGVRGSGIGIALIATVIAVGVVYNHARIALAERAWELASLRVLGFTQGEVSNLLFGELALEIGMAIPCGMVGGYFLSSGIVQMIKTDEFFFPVVISPATYAYAVLCVVVAGVISAWIVGRRIQALDLVSVLKTRE